MQIPGQNDRDPLGRRLRPREGSEGFATDGRGQNIEGTVGAERVLEIQKELRDRLREQGRSPTEIEYFLRLLRRF
jgi:hypothetical protein